MNINSIAPIRIASEQDIPEIVRLVNVAFEVESFLEGTRTSEANAKEMLQKGVYFVVEHLPGELIATIYTEVRGDRGYFGMLAVKPGLQGKGFGRMMIEYAEAYCRNHGCKFMDLKVLSPRTELPGYYRSLGYSEAGMEEFVPTRPLKEGIECYKILMSRAL